VSRQPDFSTTPRPSRAPALENVAVALGLVAVVLAGGAAWRARDEARAARARLDEVRREVEAATARLSSLEASARTGRPGLAAADAEPARIVADVATVLPGDARLERLSIDYVHGGAVELAVVARDAAAWDRLLDRLEQAPQFREVEPGPEARDAEVRSLVRARWVGGPR
jgi:Tfp pilus assembly protein PilN